MKISPDSWHYKLYVFMCQWNAAWRGKNDYWEYPRQGNMIGLCPYMRMILIWGPLAILSNLIPIAAIVGTFFLFPASLNGVVGIAWLLGTIFALAAGILGIGYVSHLIGKLEEGRRREKLDREFFEDEPSKPTKTFRGLVWDYVVAVKTKMCPVLEVEKND